MGLKSLRIVSTGGDTYESEREQWDDGNNVVAVEPGVVIGYDATSTPTRCCAGPALRSSP
ncbi:arginine deiminase [Rhizobium sp. SLBN-94]|nr:arginine deiminase [Rhizobium sp. SLBN-94]